MKRKIKQWLMVNDEICRTDENAMRYLDMLYYNVKHQDLHLYQSTVCKNSTTMNIITIVADSKEVYDDFCEMADKVNGLYSVCDIIENATKVLAEKSIQ